MSAVLARRILEIERAGGSGAEKLRRLIDALSPAERATVPGQWLVERGPWLLWEDNLLDWAEAVDSR